MSTTKSKRGRPRVAADVASVTLSVDAGNLEMADGLAEDLGRVLAGLRHSRGDVLRAALARGLSSMRAELDEKLAQQTKPSKR